MHSIVQYLQDLRTENNYGAGVVNLISSAIFQVFVVFYTMLVILSGRCIARYKRRRTRKRLEKANSLSYGTRNLLVLSGSEFEIRRSDLTTYWRIRDDFFIDFPKDLRKEMLSVKPDYVFREASRSIVLDELKREASEIIPNLDLIIDRARIDAALLTINRARQSTRVFNGFVFQAYDIVPSVIDDRDENPTLSLVVYRTDYFTLTCLLMAFRQIQTWDIVKNQSANQSMPRKLSLFYNGIGLNVLVVSIDSNDGSMRIVLRKRSARAMATVATGQWHVTANEALSTTEVEETEVLFETWVRRALKEEAGFKNLGEWFIFSCFLVLDDMQPGISVLAFCTFDHQNLQSMMDSSKDGMLEYGATKLVPFDDASVAEVLRGVPGIKEGNMHVPLSAVAENLMRGIAARGVENILSRAGLVRK